MSMQMKDDKTTIIINLKKLNGSDAIDLIEKLNKTDNKITNKYNIILAVQTLDVPELSKFCKFKIYVQDIFSETKNSFLQCQLDFCENVKGVILNHPEKKLTVIELEKSLKKAKQFDLETIICATSIEEAIQISTYSPMYIGFEHETLIGKDISFTTHCPEILKQVKSQIDSKILIGAGIKTNLDLKYVLQSGGSGVLISSLILKSTDPLYTLSTFLN
jgi:triosephosphate isomerase